jgi:elongation factor Ts
MAKVTMELVKELREKTQVGMLACKNALIEADGNIEKAIELLRKKGAAVAAKRADNATDNGRIEAMINDEGTTGTLVEISCETDFSANTDAMKSFTTTVATVVMGNESAADKNVILEQTPKNGKLTISQMLEELISKIAEKITISNIARFETKSGIVNAYVHAGSTLGIITELEVTEKTDIKKLMELAKDISMQIAVTNPLSVDSSQLDETTIAKEKEVFAEQLKTKGKPENIIAKIVEGKMKKYYEEVCLLNQKYIKNDKITIAQHIEEIAKEINTKIEVKQFKRFKIGK